MKLRLTFSLRAILVAVAIVAALSAVMMSLRSNELKRQRLTAEDSEHWASVNLQSYKSSGKSYPLPWRRRVSLNLVGGAHDTAIDLVDFSVNATSDQLDDVIALFPEITQVHLHFSTASTENISKLQRLPLLQKIQINDGRIGLKDLREMGKLKQRPEISFQNIHLGDEFLSDVVSSEIRLKYVYSPTSAVTDDGLTSVAKLDSLISLLLNDCPISDEGFAILANHPSLSYVYLNDCHVGDAIIPTLQTIPKLRQLSLQGTTLTDEGAKMLVPMAGSLAELDIRDSKVTNAGIAALKPSCRVGALKHSP